MGYMQQQAGAVVRDRAPARARDMPYANRNSETEAFRFGNFRLDLAREQLTGPDGRQILRRQVFATLRLLLEAAPAVVSLDELLDGVWGRHALCASAVPRVIVELRRALGDAAQAPRYIETRHRRGYRMIPTVLRELAMRHRADPSTTTPGGLRAANCALLGAIDTAAASCANASPRLRLERLHQAAAERGLPLLALQVRLALRACEDEEST